MELIRQFGELISRVETINGQDATRREARGIQTRAEQLAPVAAAFENLGSQVVTLRRHQVPVTVPAKTGALAAAAEEVIAAFEQDKRSLIDPPNELRYRFWDQLGETMARIDGAVREVWREHVRTAMPRVDRTLFEALPTVTQAHRFELVALGEEERRLLDAVPGDDGEYERLEGLVGRYERLLAALSIEQLPDDVRTFIRAVTQQHATLDLITPSVLAWLASNGLTRRVQVQFDGRS